MLLIRTREIKHIIIYWPGIPYRTQRRNVRFIFGVGCKCRKLGRSSVRANVVCRIPSKYSPACFNKNRKAWDGKKRTKQTEN